MSTARSVPPTTEPLDVAAAKDHLRVEFTDDDTLIAALITAAREYVERVCRRQLTIATWELKLDAFPAVITLPYPPLAQIVSIQYVDADGVTQTLSTDTYVAYGDRLPAQIREAYAEYWPATRGHHDDVTIKYRSGYAAPFTVAADTDVCTVAGRTFTDGDPVRLDNVGGEDGALPESLSADTTYYVRDASDSTFKLAATSAGDAIDITGAGAGTHLVSDERVGILPQALIAAIKLLVADMYEHREAVADLRTYANPTVDRLLWPYRILEV